MEYIERYLYQVGRYLPQKEKEEVINELRELLEDEVSSLQGNNLSPKDLEKNQLTVLKNFGRPEMMAIKYGGGIRPLIPVELMPAFTTVLKILLVVYIILFVVLGFVSGTFSVDYLTSFFSNAITNFGIIVIIFFLIGRRKGDSQVDKTWTPKSLPEVPGKEKIKQLDIILSVAFNSFFLIVLTLFPGYIGIVMQYQGEWMFTPVKLNFLDVFLPFINLWLIAKIFVDVYVLKLERWTQTALLSDIIIHILGMALAYMIYQHGIIVELDTERLPEGTLTPLMSRVGALVMMALMIGFTINIVVKTIKLIRLRS